jgi:hypothetical protein
VAKFNLPTQVRVVVRNSSIAVLDMTEKDWYRPDRGLLSSQLSSQKQVSLPFPAFTMVKPL